MTNASHAGPARPLLQGRDCASPFIPAPRGSLLAALRADVNRDHVRKAVAARGWTEGIDRAAKLLIHVATDQVLEDQYALERLRSIRTRELEFLHG